MAHYCLNSSAVARILNKQFSKGALLSETALKFAREFAKQSEGFDPAEFFTKCGMNQSDIELYVRFVRE